MAPNASAPPAVPYKVLGIRSPAQAFREAAVGDLLPSAFSLQQTFETTNSDITSTQLVRL